MPTPPRFALLAVALVIASVLAGCGLEPPPGDAPLRYRDAIFTNVTRTDNISYGSAVGVNSTTEDLKLDLFRPSGDTHAARPAMVWIHGGGFKQGDKSSGASIATYLAQRGYVAVSINYRLTSPTVCAAAPEPKPLPCTSPALAAQHDAQAAVRWLRRHAATYNIDPNKIAAGGGSAGGVTTVRLATDPEHPGTSGNPGYPSEIQSAVSVSGGLPVNDTITPGDAPTLFLHGNKDNVVPIDWAISNVHAMNDAGVPAYLYPFVGAGHGLFGDPVVRAKGYEQTNYWLYYTLISRTGAQQALR